MYVAVVLSRMSAGTAIIGGDGTEVVAVDLGWTDVE